MNKNDIVRKICIYEGCNNYVSSWGKRNGVNQYRTVCYKHHKEKTKKNYCENRDGRLGYKCTAEIQNLIQLEIDHIDGNRKNNKAENKQTLCANCHRYKTMINEDWKH